MDSKETSAQPKRCPLFSKETCFTSFAPLRLFSKEAALCHDFATAKSRNDRKKAANQKVDSSSEVKTLANSAKDSRILDGNAQNVFCSQAHRRQDLENLESTFENNAENKKTTVIQSVTFLEKVDSSVEMDCHDFATAKSRNDRENSPCENEDSSDKAQSVKMLAQDFRILELESTFENNANKTHKVDSRETTQNVENSAQDSRILEGNAQNVFCSQAHRRQDFGDKNGALQGESRAHTLAYVTADSPQQSPFLAQKPTPKPSKAESTNEQPTPKPNQAQSSSQAKTTHPYTRKLLNAITLPKKVDSSAGEVCLSLRDFGVYYTTKGFFTRRKTLAIQGVNLRLRAGDSIGIIGASGSGKSSLALGILGLEGHSGELCLPNAAQEPLIYTSTKRDKAFVSMVQIVFQDPLLALNPRMCVLEILQEALQSRNAAKTLTLEATRLLEQVGLSGSFLYRYSANLSGGEAQRVCIARALASGARILLLDEPTSALDKSTQKDIITLLLELQQRLNLSYLVISHDLSVIEAMCGEVLVLESGQVVEQGAVAQVFSAPTHPCTRALLAARI